MNVKPLLKTALALLLALCVAGGGLLVLMASESGSRWLIGTIAETASIDLEIGIVRGNLLGRIELEKITAKAGVRNLALERLSLAWRPSALLGGELAVSELKAEGVDYRDHGPPQKEETKKAFAAPEIPLPVRLSIDALGLSRIRIVYGDDSYAVERLNLAAKSDWRKLRIGALNIKTQEAEVAATAEADLPRLDNLKAEISWRYDHDQQGVFSGAARIGGKPLALTVEHALIAPFVMDTRGTVNLEGPVARFDLGGDWRELKWPIRGDASVKSRQGSYRFYGSEGDYRIRIKGGLEGRDFPEGAFLLEGRGGADALKVQTLRLDAFGGILDATGNAGWRDGVDVDFDVFGNGLDFSGLTEEWPGRLDAVEARLRFGESKKVRRLYLNFGRLKGDLRGYPFAAVGVIESDGESFRADRLKIDSGDNSLRIDGKIDSALALDFSLDAPDLAALHPALAGGLKGGGRIGGSRESPKLTAALSGNKLGFRSHGLKTLDLSLEFDAADQGKIDGKLEAEGISLAGSQFDGLELAVKGVKEKQRISMRLGGPPGVLNAALTGGYRNERWKGLLESLSLETEAAGKWRLPQSAALLVTGIPALPEAFLDRTCLTQQDARICLEGEWRRSSDFAAKGQISDFPLSLVQGYLPENAAVKRGALFGKFKAERRKGILKAQARFDLTPGEIEMSGDLETPFTIAYRDAFARIDSTDSLTEMEYNLSFEDAGQSSGNVRIGPEGRLDGRVSAEFADLKFFSALMPALESPAGRLNADFLLRGSLEKPRLKASAALTEGQADLPDLGLELRDIRLDLRNRDERTLSVSGAMRSGEGRVEIDGTLVPDPDRGWPLDLAVRGDKFQVARLPEARAWISPDLKFTRAEGISRLTGELRVPAAEIELKELPSSAVRVSKDEVIVGGNGAAGEPRRKSVPIDARVEVLLGEDVSFKGYGLSAGLGGRLEIVTREGAVSAQGEVNLKNGRYRTYGQNLTIDRGRFLFAGPADNPNLDIKATRVSKTDQVKAILSLSGPLQSPQTRVYSEPPLAENEALAYLLTGRPLNRANQAQNAMLAGAALSYGLEYAQPLTQQIGIDVLEVESKESLKDSSVVLGKYLTPDLYIGYITDLFGGSPAVSVKYRLTKHLSVESRSGTSQSLDLRYGIEHD